MNRKEHIEFAKFVAERVYIQEMQRLGIQRDYWKDLLAKKAINWIGKHIGTLPDKLEPGKSQYHRKIFHSQDVYDEIEEWKQNILSNPSKNWWWDVFRLMAYSAYQSHILLDSRTSMGVPEYGWVRDLIELFKSKKSSKTYWTGV